LEEGADGAPLLSLLALRTRLLRHGRSTSIIDNLLHWQAKTVD